MNVPRGALRCPFSLDDAVSVAEASATPQVATLRLPPVRSGDGLPPPSVAFVEQPKKGATGLGHALVRTASLVTAAPSLNAYRIGALIWRKLGTLT